MSKVFSSLVFVLLEGEQNIGVGVFVYLIYDVILYPYLVSFGLFNNIIFRIFNCCICFRR